MRKTRGLGTGQFDKSTNNRSGIQEQQMAGAESKSKGAALTAAASPRLQFEPHPHRGLVLGEVHARPFRPVGVPARLLHFAFVTDHAGAERDRLALIRFCEDRGVASPAMTAKQHVARLGDAVLRWEQHGEFTTYTWDVEVNEVGLFTPGAAVLAHPMELLPQPGPHLCSVDLQILPENAVAEPLRGFDASSLCHSRIDDGGASLSTDLKPGVDGFVRYLVVTGSDDPARIGAMAQQILELETYRSLALLGLPEAQKLGPQVRRIEDDLAVITDKMRESHGLSANNELLDRLTQLAAKLEADAAASFFRFGASGAYDDIMRARMRALGEVVIPGRSTLEEFLTRRHVPAMRTCQAIVERQENLSRKLSRATQLLRTRVEVEIEQQNRDLLDSMNKRTQLQLRLQQTVEGLSVVAISYYLVGLFSYIAKAAQEEGLISNSYLATAIFVPVAMFSILFLVWRFRKKHLGGDH
jgi:uncharacterized membrane-anchored protein